MKYVEALTFKDPDLTTPQHDEIMCWLDEKMPEVLDCLFWPNPSRNYIRKTWEHPVTHYTGYNGSTLVKVGHVDMLVEFTDIVQETVWKDGKWRNKEITETTETVVFEVKPKIQSLGELLRQIRHYQTYLVGKYVVVSPDTRFIKQLFKQNVGFVEIPFLESPSESYAEIEWRMANRPPQATTHPITRAAFLSSAASAFEETI